MEFRSNQKYAGPRLRVPDPIRMMLALNLESCLGLNFSDVEYTNGNNDVVHTTRRSRFDTSVLPGTTGATTEQALLL